MDGQPLRVNGQSLEAARFLTQREGSDVGRITRPRRSDSLFGTLRLGRMWSEPGFSLSIGAS